MFSGTELVVWMVLVPVFIMALMWTAAVLDPFLESKGKATRFTFELPLLLIARACFVIEFVLFWHAWNLWPGSHVLRWMTLVAIVVLLAWWVVIAEEYVLPRFARSAHRLRS